MKSENAICQDATGVLTETIRCHVDYAMIEQVVNEDLNCQTDHMKGLNHEAAALNNLEKKKGLKVYCRSKDIIGNFRRQFHLIFTVNSNRVKC